jgi:hypothetical protein
MSAPDTKPYLFASAFFVVIGIVLGTLNGWQAGSILGGIVAVAGAIPAAWAAWVAMRAESQGPLARSLLMIFLSLGVGALFIVLWVIQWVRQ